MKMKTKEIKKMHEKEIKKAKERIMNDIEYLIRAYTQIEIEDMNETLKSGGKKK